MWPDAALGHEDTPFAAAVLCLTLFRGRSCACFCTVGSHCAHLGPVSPHSGTPSDPENREINLLGRHFRCKNQAAGAEGVCCKLPVRQPQITGPDGCGGDACCKPHCREGFRRTGGSPGEGDPSPMCPTCRCPVACSRGVLGQPLTLGGGWHRCAGADPQVHSFPGRWMDRSFFSTKQCSIPAGPARRGCVTQRCADAPLTPLKKGSLATVGRCTSGS
jgi:hypothetical protein